MTATVTESARGAFSGDIIAGIRANGIVRVPAGTLWERVAERSEQIYRYVWHGGMPPGPSVCEVKNTAWILGPHVCPRRASHGIIRAGERIK